MEDLSEKLAGILNDPGSMERVRQMAEQLLGEKNEEQPSASAPLDVSALPDAEELKKVMSIVSRLKNSGGDSRTALLLALRPHLSEPRQAKVDTAVKILRLLDLLPYLKESGLFF